MNKPIRTIAIFCLLLFLGLMLNATYLQYYRAGDLNEDPRNRRVLAEAFSSERGAILVGRTPVAESVPSDDQYDFQRKYPQPFKYAHLTGWFSYFSQTQLELTQNSVLSGDDSRLFVTRLVDLFSNSSAKGGSVQLTIDPAAQSAAYDGLRALGEGVEGSVVAIEPSSGRILAMVSLPTYDPNELASHDFGAVAERAEQLEARDDEPLLNRAIQTRLPPGSTYKIVTAAAAIESGNYDASSQVPGGATYQLPETSGESGLIDNEGRDCGSTRIPFTQAMGNSCNTTFARLAIEVGADAMLEQAEKFGFNSDYLEDLPNQAESNFPVDMNPPETGQSGIGQFEVAATPLQMAMVSAGIANGGTVMKPYMVEAVLTPELDVLPRTEPEELSEAVSAQTASDLTELMTYTVSSGTASPAAIPNVEVAGKTGTAQSGQDDVPPYAWFTSFAPADDPDVAVAVMIQSAPGTERGEIAGGALGGPIAKAVMEAVIDR
ncbi:peptidoglycan D,D-transpeptidase FtsI family protein [Nocardioides euryhalodurans]|uniref:Penicillin-binding protein 2 n=1 Tax=Nocardioides euryhalodurans TaxID=2518370 RepID=A0A4P7GLY8_9ACTN|nr:penicillin-binding protein 2 [Nocardioides euryhalodurans]QBR92864.1 penicillin-binding protein 2 [Nocardioides euryhalodurans]